MAAIESALAGDARPPYVLVCDDSPTNCLLLKTLLVREGFKVTVTNGGEEALTELRRHPFEIVLLDIEMAGMTGIDVTLRLRESQSDKVYLPVILLTANIDHEARMAGLRAGATDFLTKPFDPLELVARIRNHVAAKRLHDRLAATNKALSDERAKVFHVQQALLPAELPRIPGLAFAAGYLPCDMAGGDFYDTIVRANGNLLLAIGDVSGHGIPSAMYMATLRAVLHAEQVQGTDLLGLMKTLNRILRFCMEGSSFVTFYLAEFDPNTRELRQVTAGHHAPLLVDVTTGASQELPIHPCFPLGLDEDPDFQERRFVVPEGSRLVLYTDGLIEQCNLEGDFYGLERLQESMKMHRDLPAKAALQRLLGEYRQFCGRNRQRDDLTVLIVDFLARR